MHRRRSQAVRCRRRTERSRHAPLPARRAAGRTLKAETTVLLDGRSTAAIAITTSVRCSRNANGVAVAPMRSALATGTSLHRRLEVFAHLHKQLLAAEGLRYVAVATYLAGRLRERVPDVRSDRNHGDVFRCRVALDLLDHFDTADLWHRQVGEYQVELVQFHLAQRILTAVRRDDLIAGGIECMHEDPHDVRIILYHQNFRHRSWL